MTSKTNLLIREARTDEHTTIAEMHNRILAIHNELLPELFKKPSPLRDVVNEMRESLKANGFVFVADLGAELVGYIGGRIKNEEENLRRRSLRTVCVDALYVKPWAQRRCNTRISHALYEAVVSLAEKEGAQAITFDFWLANEASALFCRSLPTHRITHMQERHVKLL